MIFERCRYQLIMSMGGPVDIAHEPIHRAMDLYGVNKKKECFEKVLTIGRWWLKKLNEKKGSG